MENNGYKDQQQPGARFWTFAPSSAQMTSVSNARALIFYISSFVPKAFDRSVHSQRSPVVVIVGLRIFNFFNF